MAVALALAALAGCRVEGAGRRSAADTTAAARRPTGPMHTVFNRRRETLAPGLERVTISAIVRLDIGQDSAKRVMESLLAAERRSDSAAAAIRVLAYLPPPQGHGTAGQQAMTLIPLGFTDWAPAPGFDSLSAATRRNPYATTTRFLHDEATLRGMLGPGQGGMPQLPRGQLPPGHPAPRGP